MRYQLHIVTTESECIAESTAVKELVWIQHLIKELTSEEISTEFNMDKVQHV